MEFGHTTATGGHTMRRVEEKEQLQILNQRFSNLIDRVRKLTNDNNSRIDPASLMREIRILEDGAKSLKEMYEKELDKSRNRENDQAKENNLLQNKFEKSYQLCKDLQARLDAENAKNAALSDEVKRLRMQISQMEIKIREVQDSASKPHAELERLRGDLKKCLRDLEAANARYEQECSARQDAENRAKAADSKLLMAKQVYEKEIHDLKQRLDAANANLMKMEAKLKASKSSASMEEICRPVREAADRELNKFKEDTIRQFEKDMRALKEQIDSDARLIAKLTAERQKAVAEAEDAKLRNKQLEGQIAALQAELRNFEAQVGRERELSKQQLQALTSKMNELQDRMHKRFSETGGFSADNVMLKPEIAALQVMLKKEKSTDCDSA